jgi:hypothetical protein
MALTATEEALVRQLLDQQAAILSLAGNEATITSKLGATKVTLSDLVAASSMADTDLLLTRQGTSDKSLAASILAQYCSEEFLASIATPPQFDNDTSLATTEFVQRALGSYAGWYGIAIAVDTTLDVSAVGKVVLVSSGVTVTLPPASSVPQGSVIAFSSSTTAAGTYILKGSGPEVIASYSTNGNTREILNGTTVKLVCAGSIWAMAEGGEQYQGLFTKSLSGNGYQKLPSGLIIQWMQFSKTTTASPISNSWPIAFPTALWNISGTIGGAANPNGGAISASGDTTQATIYTTSGQPGSTIMVIGIGN